jgi:hypothetical protein
VESGDLADAVLRGAQCHLSRAQQGGHLMDRGGGVPEPTGHPCSGHLLDESDAWPLETRQRNKRAQPTSRKSRLTGPSIRPSGWRRSARPADAKG